MYDTIGLILKREDVPGGINFLDDVPGYLSRASETNYENGQYSVCGYLGGVHGLKVSVSENNVKLIRGSLCKWMLGNNLSTLTRHTTEEAITRLSDELHLDMSRARVTRLDVSANLLMKHPCDVYFPILGEYPRAERLEEPNGIYYMKRAVGWTYNIYDKVREVKSKHTHEPIPELYKGRHVLRLETRYTKNVGKQLNTDDVRAVHLYDEAFYTNVCDRWLMSYEAIRKYNQLILPMNEITTKKQFLYTGLNCLIDKIGGVQAMLRQIKANQLSGSITNKQAHDLREAVRQANEQGKVRLEENPDVQELDRKVKSAIKYYR